MTAATAPREGIRPFALRICDALSLGPLRLGLYALLMLSSVLLVVSIASGAASELVAGTAEEWLAQDARVAVILTLILAYLPAAQSLVAKRAEQSVQELAPVLDLDPAGLSDWANRVCRVDSRTHRLACALGFLTVAGLAFLPEVYVEQTLQVGSLPALAILHRVQVACIGVLAGSAIALTRTSSRVLSELTVERGQLDLFDLSAWSPLVRVGLANAFANVGLVSLLLLLLPDRDAGAGLTWPLVFFVLMIAGLAILGLVMPLRGLRDRIRVEKKSRLDAFRRELASVMGDTAPPTGRLADLTAYKQLLGDVSVWPLDLPQTGRFALLFGLPLLSWIAAALVERLLDMAIG